MIEASDIAVTSHQAGEDRHFPPFSGKLAGRHICIVLASLGAGGAERVVAWLARQLVSAGSSVTIISFDRPEDPVYHDFGHGVRLRRLGIDAKGRGGGLLPPAARRIIALRRTLREIAPDIAVGFLTKINTLLLAASAGMDVPVIVAERNNPQLQPAHPMWKHALRLLYRRADRIICQTRASMVCVPQVCHANVRVIPNPVSAPAMCRSAPDGAGGRVIASVGRLERQKGFDLLIRAFAEMAGKAPGWDLDIWGEGPERENLAALAASLGVADRVNLRGLSDRPGGWIEQADLFVLASRYEGFPNVLGEAMAAGLPVISANCDFGPAELVRDGETGLLVPPEDVDALAAALLKMTGDDAFRDRLANAAPEVAQTFSNDRVANAWSEVLGSVLKD
ncbi:glycosyltransferase involved in cell wall biosynthesis [Altererythrobacter atlanticus]|uniref:GalNAc-alpha-(1->4)-GalNAc-alpha-(1->3)-diNAcBac-PP-undecaprenol alpha-1,4-N-acetyl-D-galactosaminyltransferase n=1 Tax=Croceibacterium atlanticum TaxID=1267766 RepID=A0A0F7KU93_9SPHN|nr:glycosyltransferase family 4 protein [Croceibacterium atlanticum]AKH42842.1 GalNAc-alpha-(1->4)-GalNAc-alpha-(1->3)-diNAcBac-PP-undecaprenol alpha-1,4-N-acetyl-D-galactosaminyltransferase [Croceibacterium atlanticum]MBB5731622.1 glycosyltransferase involved in cell wall biosynthesis [Croceibacterium atlanticum]